MAVILDNHSDELSATFAALADPTRRQIVARLSRGRATVGELVEPFKMSWPAVTKHLRVLEDAGLVRRHCEGRHRILELNAAPMNQARDWMDHHRRFWQASFDALADYLERGITKQVKRPRRPKK